MIIASLSHPSGESAYFPHLSARKTIDQYDGDWWNEEDFEQLFP
jgi:hypothetical protein